MKFKSMGTFLTSLVLAVAASYTVSALAEAADAGNTTGSAVQQQAPASSDQSTMNQMNSSMPASGSMPSSNNVGGSDDVTPDTATGDDDY